MQPSNRFNFNKKRDFGEIINATFTFIKQHFKPLFKGGLFIAGPVVLFGGIFNSIFTTHFFTLTKNPNPNPSFLTSALGYMGIGYLFLCVGFVMFSAVILSYVKLYVGGKENISVSDLWNACKGKILPLIGLGIVAYFMIAIGFVVLILPGIYLALALSFSGVAVVLENKGVFSSISRSFQVVSGHWWSLFGLMFVISIITAIISYAFMIPMYLVLFLYGMNNSADPQTAADTIIGFSSTFSAIYTPFYMLVSMLVSTISIIALVVKYYSILEEKEGIGILQEIDSLDTEVQA